MFPRRLSNWEVDGKNSAGNTHFRRMIKLVLMQMMSIHGNTFELSL